jgi:D-alanine-D-alanine ligase
MRIAIVHDHITDADGPDGQDVLEQAQAVTAALIGLGHEAECLTCDLNLVELGAQLRQRNIDLVFNLVESINGKGSLIHLLPFFWAAMGMPYTGCRAEAMVLTSSKILAKRLMSAGGIPIPQWIDTTSSWPDVESNPDIRDWIVKSVWEHASIGLDNDSLLRSRAAAEVRQLLPERAHRLGGLCFAEHYIDGREFNLALLAGPRGPELLPPAEIIFENFPPDRPRIVDYAAKWDEDSFACRHTRRCFEFPPQDEPLLTKLAAIARHCWHFFALNGYARVDFRVDDEGRPWVLEVNANPCLAPDAGFAAALQQADISFIAAIARIVADSSPPASGVITP